MASSSCTFSSFSSRRKTVYDVFLSFRGEDTRNNFTSHLYEALSQKGIYTFLDDDKLERGRAISPGLFNAIEDSQCSIIILSKNYASSSWCLDELVKILQCMKNDSQIVLPIFYHVDPSHVRKQIGSIGEAFQRHEQVLCDNLEKVQIWRDALKEVANLAGWHVHDRNEAKFIQDFIIEVSSKLDIVPLNISEDLFGMDTRLAQLNLCIHTSSEDDIRFIGICGMGGIGKSTLARTYYEWKSSQFEGSSFLANIREVCKKDGLVSLQDHLLSDILKGLPKELRDVHEGMNMIRSRLCHKKVLIVLDDVDKLSQLEVLAKKDNWFGLGSRIIVTTRDESLLQSTYKECIIYRVKELNNSEGLQLFTWKAFKSSQPSEDYMGLSKQVIDYASGLPLALEVVGSFLCGKSIKEWKSALDRLTKYPKKEITKVLQISFEGLEEIEKSIFLDIACFFNGGDKDDIVQILDSCGFFPEIGIRVLIDKSLLHIHHGNQLWMHSLLQEMGKDLVREKSRNEPGRQSRIWDTDDYCHVLEYNMGTEEVEAIVCPFPFPVPTYLSLEAFSNMKKLRLLIIWERRDPHMQTASMEYLSNELKYLRWPEFEAEYLPSNFQPGGLVHLEMITSNIKHLWNNLIKPLHKLKIVKLSFSLSLTKFDDFGMIPNLEELILEGCTHLVELHLSIELLERLSVLNLAYCFSLENLPTSISGLKSLKILKLDECTVNNLPWDLGFLSSLEELHLKGFKVRGNLPHSIPLLKNLKTLTCGERANSEGDNSETSGQWKAVVDIIVGHVTIPEIDIEIGGLYSLKSLDLSNCGLGEGAIPEAFGCLVFLEELHLRSNYFSSLPPCIKQLSKLTILDLSSCERLKSLGPELPPSLQMVRVDHCTALDIFLDPSDNQCNYLNCSASCKECFGLLERQGSERTALASLKRYLQNPPSLSRRFDIVLPANGIPVWFTHRSSENSGTSISIELDPNWCNSKCRGFALSLCFVRIGVVLNDLIDIEYWCYATINGQDWRHGRLKSPIKGKIYEPHLWLLYLPCDIYFCTELENNNKSSQIEFSFETTFQYSVEDHLTIFDGECGARLVYEQDIEDLNRIVNECIV